MSDLGLLSHQYQAMAELARQLRRDVLRIKRLYYGLPLPANDKETDIKASLAEFRRIVEFLGAVVPLAEEEPWPERWLDDPPLPSALVENLRKIHTLDAPQYIKTLKRLEQRLQQDITALKEKDIFLLEEIAQSASADANTVFRRLMRWA
jgi:hypothetical protein